MTDMNTTVLADRYRLIKHLARGGMADVYVATDELLGRKVAVKMLHANYATDAAFIQRFRREAQAAANLTHPNIVSIYDTGQDGNHHFIVMELVEGTTLRDVVKSPHPVLPRRAAEIAAEVAAALAVAARSGLAHRDVKPGNILLTEDGNVKVTDFGIARAWDDSEELTRTGAVIGTATYFSPEQAQGLPADGRSDIYSLGVVLYEMLAGQPPFSGESPVAVAYQHVSEIAAPPSGFNPDVPPELDAIVMRALEKSPQVRYQTADDMRQDLLRFLQGAPVAASDPEAATLLVAAAPPPTAPPDEVYRQIAELPPERSAPWSLIVASLALLAVVALAIVFISQGLGTPSPEDLLVEMPDLVGISEDRALVEIQELDLFFTLAERPSDEVGFGEVAATIPPAGELVGPNDRVTLVISSGPETFTVPNVVGRGVVSAQESLAEARFTTEIVLQTDPDIRANDVISQTPPAGENHPPGTSVTLIVSSGPEQVVLSEYSGFSSDDAKRDLESRGVSVVVRREFHPTIPDDEVIRTEPPALSIITQNDTVSLIVSSGPQPVAVPDLIGKTQAEAEGILAGLKLSIVFGAPILVEDAEQAGIVLEQTPAPVEGLLVEPGTPITVRIGELPPPPPSTTTTTTTTTVP